MVLWAMSLVVVVALYAVEVHGLVLLVNGSGQAPVIYHVTADFGPKTYNITAAVKFSNVSLELCGQPMEGSDPQVRGNIMLIKRGTCHFAEKALNAQNLGAIGVVVYDEHLDDLKTMTQPEGWKDPINIPSVFISNPDGLQLLSFAQNQPGFAIVMDTRGEVKIMSAPTEFISLRNTTLLLFLTLSGFVVFTLLQHFCVAGYRYCQRSQRMLRIPERRFGDGVLHNDACAICLDDFNQDIIVKVLPCNHGFHVHCIDPWLRDRSDLCPICKASIFDEGQHRLGQCGVCMQVVYNIFSMLRNRIRPSRGDRNVIDSSSASNSILQHDLLPSEDCEAEPQSHDTRYEDGPQGIALTVNNLNRYEDRPQDGATILAVNG
eukprot:gb/GEZN01007405.1/.p1 GENE.gb/GEZN01007405.1/~~gb/GEZN01007405.1/.p1  ORF type:complete len:376 (-),score=15.98 gb/GEZN01007405.1/:357-1484(-)